ncbi:MAG: DUF4169 family protein [Pseudomonadota bacterium]
MNARIINLRTARKQKARAQKQAKAVERVREGSVTKSDRDAARRGEAARVTRLDAHRKGDDDG